MAITNGAVNLTVLVEPFKNVLSVTAMLAFLTPDKPHLQVTAAHVHGTWLMLQTFQFLIYLIVQDPNILEADRACWN